MGALASFAQLPMKTVRPADAAGIYAQPRQQLARLANQGMLHRVANGYYTVVPLEEAGTAWLPSAEAAAAGIATADFGPDNAILMGISAARMHGVIPRALATVVVAVPRQRAVIQLKDRPGTVLFVKRRTDRLDAELLPTELGKTLVTTAEQTILDLAHRPDLGHARTDVPTAIRALLARSDRDWLAELAAKQRLRAALDRALRLSEPDAET